MAGGRAPEVGMVMSELKQLTRPPLIGERMTKHRVAIYEALRSRTDHPDVEALLPSVRRRVPGISVFTLYRNLNAFEAAGLIDRVATWQGRARYCGNVEPHGHFLCEPCGRIVDIEDQHLDLPEIRSRNGRYGEIERVAVLLRGTCAECAQVGLQAGERDERGMNMRSEPSL